MRKKQKKQQKRPKSVWEKIFRLIKIIYKYIKNNPWRCSAIAAFFIYLILQFQWCEGNWVRYFNRNIRGARYSVQAYYWLLTMRYTVQWFPNINPYIHPLYGLIWATDLFLRQFDKFLPTILGIDFSAMCAFTFLEWMMQTLDVISVVTKEGEELW